MHLDPSHIQKKQRHEQPPKKKDQGLPHTRLLLLISTQQQPWPSQHELRDQGTHSYDCDHCKSGRGILTLDRDWWHCERQTLRSC